MSALRSAWSGLLRQVARPQGRLSAQPAGGVKVAGTCVQVSCVLAHQPPGSLGGGSNIKKHVCRVAGDRLHVP
jgi:hypothetical protein